MEHFNPENHGEWKTASLYAGGVVCYQCYRLRDKDATDHSGNREYAGPVFDNEQEAKVWLAANLRFLPK